MFKYIASCLVILLSLIGSVSARSTHDVRTAGEEQATWWGDAGQAYVRSGCVPGTSGTTTITITSCSAYIRDFDPLKIFRYVQEDSRTFALTAGDGTYWLGVKPTPQEAISGWQGVVNTHYVYKLSADVPVVPNRVLLINQITVSGGAVTAVDGTLAPNHPFQFDSVEYLTQHGGVCDGTTNNDAAIASAIAASPLTGGEIAFPASPFPCVFDTKICVTTKPIVISGAGKAGTSKGQTPAATTLLYTGSDDCAIEITGGPTRGSVVRNFELDHTGTADYGVCFGTGNSNAIREVSLNSPTVQFAEAGFRIGDTGTTTHSHTIENNTLTNSAPVGVELRRTIAVQITNNTINHHSAHDIVLGSTNTAKETYVIGNRLETNFTGYTSAWAMHWKNVEGGVFKYNHFEIGNGADGIAHTDSTDTKCESCIFENNQVNMLDTTPPGDGLFFFDAPGANPAVYAYIRNNRIEDNRTAPPATNLVELGNTSGDGGASVIVIDDNNITATLGLESHESRIKVMYDHGNNYSLGVLRDSRDRNLCIQHTAVGNVTTGEDNLMPACTVLNNRIRTDGVGLSMVFSGEYSNANENKRLRLYIDGTVVWDSGAFNLATDVTFPFYIQCDAVRSSTMGLRTWCRGNRLVELVTGTADPDAHTHTIEQFEITKTTYTAVTSLDGLFADPFDIQLTGEATTTNAIRQYFQKVRLVQK